MFVLLLFTVYKLHETEISDATTAISLHIFCVMQGIYVQYYYKVVTFSVLL